MSQLSHALLQSSSVRAFQPSIGQQVTPVNGKIYALGDGINIMTNASGNTIYAVLNNTITITSATIGNVSISGNTIGTATGYNLNMAPVGIGKLVISYTPEGTVPLVDSLNQITASATLSAGQVIIGRTGNTPISAYLTAGSGITITNSSGSITITGSGSTNGNAGALQWSTQTWTGSGNRNYTIYPNNGYFGNSTLGTLTYPDNSSYCPYSPIFYSVAPTDQWAIGDVFWVTNRNKGNVQVRFQPDQGYAGGNNLIASIYTYAPAYGGCISTGALDASVGSGTKARSYTRNYGVFMYIYVGTLNFASFTTLDTNGNVVYKQYDKVFFVGNTMGSLSGCTTACVQ